MTAWEASPKMLNDTNQVYGSIFVSDQQKVLVVKGRESGKWSFPKGHPKKGESGFECARRETLEETGLELSNEFERVLLLATGAYYLVRSSECDCSTQDAEEVEEIAWKSFDELRRARVNIDINTFLRQHKRIMVPPPTQRAFANYKPKPIAFLVE